MASDRLQLDIGTPPDVEASSGGDTHRQVDEGPSLELQRVIVGGAPSNPSKDLPPFLVLPLLDELSGAPVAAARAKRIGRFRRVATTTDITRASLGNALGESLLTDGTHGMHMPPGRLSHRAASSLASGDSVPPASGGGHAEGGSGHGGNGGPKRKKTPSGEHPAAPEDLEGMLGPSKDVMTAAHLLDKRHSIKILTPALYPTSANQQEYRDRLFTPSMWQDIHELQRDPSLKDIEKLPPALRVQRYYELLAAADVYKAGEIPEENLGLMFGLRDQDLMNLVCRRENGGIIRKKSVEFAPGNGEISRTLLDARDRYLGLAHLASNIPQTGRSPRLENLRDFFARALESAQDIQKSADPYITSVDIVQKFVTKARKKRVNGLQADVCAIPDKFFKTTGLKPNSVDRLFMNLAFDRLSDIRHTLKNMKLLAKLDGSTEFLFGFYAPFEPNTVSFSKNPNIPEFDCFDPSSDFRERWMGLSRAETIFRIIADLNMFGFNTQRAAEHEYEVYSMHCIAEPAKVLREDQEYAFLKEYDFRDEALNARRDAVFNGQTPDDEMVGFPERENIILISGSVSLPEDGSMFEKYVDDDAK